ncbi:hypothetical protein DHL47_13565, partial [Streptococcus panodentis]
FEQSATASRVFYQNKAKLKDFCLSLVADKASVRKSQKRTADGGGAASSALFLTSLLMVFIEKK